MFPEVAPTELVVVAIVALIVVGPKDLPVLLRKIGQWMAKVRGLAADFKSSFSEMARQSELDELRREVEALRQMKTDPLGGELDQQFGEIDTSLRDKPWPEGLTKELTASGLPAWEEQQPPLPSYGEEESPAKAKPKRAAKPKAVAAKPAAKKVALAKAPAKKTAAPKGVATKAAAPKKKPARSKSPA